MTMNNDIKQKFFSVALNASSQSQNFTIGLTIRLVILYQTIIQVSRYFCESLSGASQLQ